MISSEIKSEYKDNWNPGIIKTKKGNLITYSLAPGWVYKKPKRVPPLTDGLSCWVHLGMLPEERDEYLKLPPFSFEKITSTQLIFKEDKPQVEEFGCFSNPLPTEKEKMGRKYYKREDGNWKPITKKRGWVEVAAKPYWWKNLPDGWNIVEFEEVESESRGKRRLECFSFKERSLGWKNLQGKKNVEGYQDFEKVKWGNKETKNIPVGLQPFDYIYPPRAATPLIDMVVEHGIDGLLHYGQYQRSGMRNVLPIDFYYKATTQTINQHSQNPLKEACDECGCVNASYDEIRDETFCPKCGLVIESLNYSNVRDDSDFSRLGLVEPERGSSFNSGQYGGDSIESFVSVDYLIESSDPKNYSRWGKHRWEDFRVCKNKKGTIVNKRRPDPEEYDVPLKEGRDQPRGFKFFNENDKQTSLGERINPYYDRLNYRDPYKDKEGKPNARGKNEYSIRRKKEEILRLELLKLDLTPHDVPNIWDSCLYIIHNIKFTTLIPGVKCEKMIKIILYVIFDKFKKGRHPSLAKKSSKLKITVSKKEFERVKNNLEKQYHKRKLESFDKEKKLYRTES